MQETDEQELYGNNQQNSMKIDIPKASNYSSVPTQLSAEPKSAQQDGGVSSIFKSSRFSIH